MQFWRVKMYERIKKLYLEGKLNDEGLDNALKRGWITQEQYDEIKGLK